MAFLRRRYHNDRIDPAMLTPIHQPQVMIGCSNKQDATVHLGIMRCKLHGLRHDSMDMVAAVPGIKGVVTGDDFPFYKSPYFLNIPHLAL